MSKLAPHDPLGTHEQVEVVVDRNPPGINNFVPEIYLLVVEHLVTARDVASLSKTCRRFRELTTRAGWRIFVRARFPSLIRHLPTKVGNTPDEWTYLAQSLTAQSRAWDKRAISASPLSLDSTMVRVNRQMRHFNFGEDRISVLMKWENKTKHLSFFQIDGKDPITPRPRSHQQPSPRQQTTPFHPAIDTRLEFSGSLSSKKGVVAWSTGPEAFVQVRRSGSFIPHEDDSDLNQYLNRLNSLHTEHHEFRPGHDDITSINILEATTHFREPSHGALTVDFIAGRASGHLLRYSVSDAEPFQVVVNTFRSAENSVSSTRRSVRSADINRKTGASLLAACSDKVISLYKTEVNSHDVWPVSEFEIDLTLHRSQAWTAKFSSGENLLLGFGHSEWPLHAYSATPTGLILTEKLGGKCDIKDALELTSQGVYAIEPLSGDSRTGGSGNGDIFLSGCYDGFCRLYDRRMGSSAVQSYHDPLITEAAIYSLVSFGQERFLAGSASSDLMTFDFRNSSKVYHYTDALPCSKYRHDHKDGSDIPGSRNPRYDPIDDCQYDLRPNRARLCHYHQLSSTNTYRSNTTIFLYGAPRLLNPRTWATSRNERSPIFSLSSPGPLCPLVYAGTTGMVYELEVSETDSTSSNLLDPYFAAQPSTALSIANQVELVMYEMNEGDSRRSVPDKLYVQPMGRRRQTKKLELEESRFDERWHVKSGG